MIRPRSAGWVRGWLGLGLVAGAGFALLGPVLLVAKLGFGMSSPRWFWAALTLHGLGTVAMALVMSTAAFTLVAGPWLPLRWEASRWLFPMVCAGTGLLVAGALMGYGAGWTFLHPLSATPGPTEDWTPVAALSSIAGLGLVVAAFALWCAGALHGCWVALRPPRTGGLLTGGVPPVQVVAGVVALAGLSALVVGGAGLGAVAWHVLDPSFEPSPLAVKNLVYFSGHMLTNLQIYLGAGIVYAVLPSYTGRPWRVDRMFVVGWASILGLQMLASAHHMYQDPGQPALLHVLGNAGSYGVAFPAIFVTILGAVRNVYRSGLNWTAPPLLLFLGLAGWSVGGYAAVLDATPVINELTHNTLWVPAHVHTYMGLGVALFVLGGIYHSVPHLSSRPPSASTGKRAIAAMTAGAATMLSAWYVAGVRGQPRRFLGYLDGLEPLGWVMLAGALCAAAGAVVIVGDLLRSLRSPRSRDVERAGHPR